MANKRRGEVAATIAGQTYTLCLTLGGLAELEDAFAVDDIASLAERFASGRLSSRHLAILLGAGLRGGGHPLADEEIRAFPAAAMNEIASAVASLLAATFGDSRPHPSVPQDI